MSDSEEKHDLAVSVPAKEKHDVEHDFAVSQDLVPAPALQRAGVSAVDYDGELQPPLLLHQDLRNGCGGRLWPAGRVLGKYMLRHHLAGKEVLELGAGGGLVGLSVALACNPRLVHLTDQAAMLELMQRNIALNALDARVLPSVYDWGAPTPAHLPRHPDILLAAECVYFEPAFPLLQRTLLDLLGDHTVCYFCFKRRRRADLSFMKTARKLFHVEEVTDDPDQAVWSREKLFL